MFEFTSIAVSYTYCFQQEMKCSSEMREYIVLLALHREITMAFVKASPATQVFLFTKIFSQQFGKKFNIGFYWTP